ncbi:CAP-Gly domain-containing linker protein 4-like [Aplysia californica]|uniref:CAP-Gly domain-containing linker protein 4-like n=1 Tax=Aplysia californica TaxID=6500 RepID=A0ABM1W384_APLCA|nr:CAP-Gly domain-containing linker protein 4-like [Aplysia californica]
MGPTEFGEGTWLGIELRKPKGKNDGSVQGKRYFTCPDNCGLLVKPSRVSLRGINGAKILAEQNASLAVAQNIARATRHSEGGRPHSREGSLSDRGDSNDRF